MEHIQNKFDQHTAAINLKENINNLLNIFYNGGQFIVDPSLICFTNLLIMREKSSYIIADITGDPIEITDLKEFLELLFERYEEVYNRYSFDLAELRNTRKPEQI